MRASPLLVLALLLGSLMTLAPGALACPADPHAFRFADASIEVAEVVGEVQIEVIRDGSDDCEASVLLVDEGGSATADDDYSAPTGPLVFAQGQASMTLTVDVWADELEEGEETVVLSLASLIQDPAEIGEPDEVTITIVDAVEETCANTASFVRFADATVRVDEDDGRAEVVVERVGPLDCAIEVEWSVAGLTATVDLDFLAEGGTLSMSSGTARRTLRIPIVDDSLDEPDERFRVKIDDADGPRVAVGEPDTATVTIEDNDLPPPVVTPTPSAPTNASLDLGFDPAPYAPPPMRADGKPSAAIISLYNRGSATVHDVRFRATGPFTAPTWTCFPLEPGEGCNAAPSWSTDASGILEGSLVATVNGTDVASAPLRVMLFATGLAAAPSSLDLGTFVADAWTPWHTITLTNVEPFESGPIKVVLTGGMRAEGTCATVGSLPPGGACTVLLSLISSSTGTLSTRLELASDTFGTMYVPLAGEVVPFEFKPLVAEPAHFDFREQRTRTGTPAEVVIRNPNERDVPLVSTGATAPFYVDSRIEFSACKIVPRSGTCRLPLGFAPPAPGPYAGEFFVNSSIGPLRGTLAGAGLPLATEPRVCFATPTGPCTYTAEFDIGKAPVGGAAVLPARLMSDGRDETKLYEWRSSNANFTYTHTCGATLGARPAACEVVVTFRPLAEGKQRATIDVWTTANGWKALYVVGEGTTRLLAEGAEAARIEPPARTPWSTAVVLGALALVAAALGRRGR